MVSVCKNVAKFCRKIGANFAAEHFGAADDEEFSGVQLGSGIIIPVRKMDCRSES